MTSTDHPDEHPRDIRAVLRAAAAEGIARHRAGHEPIDTRPLEDRLAAVLGRVTAAPKTGWNATHGYYFTTERDVLEQVRAALHAEGVSFEITVDDLDEIERSANGAPLYVCRVRAVFAFRANGESRESVGYGFGTDTGEKAYSKAITSAVKTFLAKTFLIAYADEEGNEPSPAQQQQRQAEAAPPALERGEQTIPYRRAWAWGKAAGTPFVKVPSDGLRALIAAAPGAWGDPEITDADRKTAETELHARGEALVDPENEALDRQAALAAERDLEPEPEPEPVSPNEAAAAALAEHDAPAPETEPDPEIDPTKGMPDVDEHGHAITAQPPMLPDTRRRLENTLRNAGKASDADAVAGIIDEFVARGFGQPWAKAELERAIATHGTGIDADPDTGEITTT